MSSTAEFRSRVLSYAVHTRPRSVLHHFESNRRQTRQVMPIYAIEALSHTSFIRYLSDDTLFSTSATTSLLALAEALPIFQYYLTIVAFVRGMHAYTTELSTASHMNRREFVPTSSPLPADSQNLFQPTLADTGSSATTSSH